jgi:hypothetical protein
MKPAQSRVRAASDKVHYLYFVTFRERCRGPVRPAHYSAIDFDGQPLRLQAKRAYEIGHSRAVFDLLLFPVNDDCQLLHPSSPADQVLQLAAPAT